MKRRDFLKTSGAAVAAASAAGLAAGEAQAAEIGPRSPHDRRTRAFVIRYNAARAAQHRPLPAHPTNGEEEAYPGFIACYSKALPHNDLGEVEPAAYRALLRALQTGDPELFERIPMGGSRRLTSPQSAFAYDLLGPDSHSLAVRPAPRMDSPEGAGEMAEVYWMALARDVPFARWDADPIIDAACRDLSALSDFRGPKAGGRVTPRTLFRGSQPGCIVGPYLSQFMWLPIPMGAQTIEQIQRTCMPGIDHLTAYGDWLAAQRGLPPPDNAYDPQRRYIRSMRDLAEWVHVDALFQAYHVACLILLGWGAPIDPGLPTASSRTQEGFVEFGGPHILTLVTEVATRALKATWYQKWLVHRRLRPEVFAGRIHNHVTGRARYPMIHGEILSAAALDAVARRYGTYLLPMAFPEGSPTHPSYTAGHATVAGACVTILKAFFDDTRVIEQPVMPDDEGLTLQPYAGPPLTVGGELDKLANNVGIGRNMAGVHYRSDNDASLRLGEAVALHMLLEQKVCHNQSFTCSLTTFDGRRVTI